MASKELTAINRVWRELGRINARLDKWEAITNADLRSDDRLISPREAGEILGIHETSVRRWVAEGRLPARRIRSRLKISLRECMAIVDSTSLGGRSRRRDQYDDQDED